MDLAQRRIRYQAIEDYRKRPLIVYATSTRVGLLAMMAGDAVREFIDEIDAIHNTDSVDVLIHSAGGDALAAWKLMSLLRERFKHVGALVPFMAFSAATIFVLGADQIVMHPHASLGPIDPQLAVPQAGGPPRPIAYEDVGAFLRFLGTEAKITEQACIAAVIEKLFSVVDPVMVGSAKRASELSSAVGERLLRTHMSGVEDEVRAKQIAENLNKSFFAHGDAVSRTRAKELQLEIADADASLESLLWDAYLGLEGYMELRRPFNPLQHYLGDPVAAQAVRLPAPAVIPPNAPPPVAQAIWQGVIQNALQAMGGTSPEVQYSLVNAVVESVRAASEHHTIGKLQAFRNINGEIQLSVVETEARWNTVQETVNIQAAGQ